jgi:hypothetical protein
MPNWPVVSLPNGAQSAKKAIKNSLEFLESYERVVLLFDMDERGQLTVDEVAELFSPWQMRRGPAPAQGRQRDAPRAAHQGTDDGHLGSPGASP